MRKLNSDSLTDNDSTTRKTNIIRHPSLKSTLNPP